MVRKLAKSSFVKHRPLGDSFTYRCLSVLVEFGRYVDNHEGSPTLRELADILGITTVAVFYHLEQLVKLGALETHKRGYRNKRLTEHGLDLIALALADENFKVQKDGRKLFVY